MATALAERIDATRARDAERLQAASREVLADAFAPPPLLTVSEWADAYRIVPSYSAEPGRWVTDKTPYLREIMDSFSDPAVNKVVFQKCARIGATEAGLNVIGFFIHQEPSPIFIVQPTVDDAKDFSKEQLTATIEETPELRKKVSEQSSRETGNTIQAKVFPGGALYLVGANSPRGFRRRTARVVILEEVDGYPPQAGTEGSQIKLSERRAQTFQHRKKIYLNSTPTLKGKVEEGGSRIEAEFLQTDQRYYLVPCPDCGHRQRLVWGQLRWDGTEAPQYCCEGCGVLIPEAQKFRMVQQGVWTPTHPEIATRGYHLNALYSPWVTWTELRDEFLAAQADPLDLQVFVNTALGETWEDKGSTTAADGLEARKEVYDAALPVVYRTMGVDVQEDRLEYVARGWGAGEETWFLERGILLGDPTLGETHDKSPWKALTAARERLGIDVACIDSGYLPNEVYKYAKPRYGRGVFVTRGYSEPGKPLVAKQPTRNNKERCPVFYVGTDAAKDTIYGRLKLSTAGALYWHFPISETCTRDYFDQLMAEKRVKKHVGGKWVTQYICPKGRRNEALDCEVGNLVALRLGSPDLERLALEAKPLPAEVPVEPAPQVQIPQPLMMPRPGGWVSGWRR